MYNIFEVIEMKYEEILEELQAAIKGLKINTQFLLLFSNKKNTLIEKCCEQTVKDCKESLLNSAEQYTHNYLAAAKLLLNCKD